MGKTTGFLEFQRKNNKDIPVEERIQNFEEFHIPLAREERKQQAARCMNCGVPFCQSAMTLAGMVTGCPLHNLIPEWNDQIYADHMQHAFSRLIKTSNFPEFTGRVCPALCEKACMCGQYEDPVTVHDNEYFLIEEAFEKGYIKPKKIAVRSGKKVAVVGSGPSGLAVADELNHRGHSITVFERDDQIGGLLMYGIPNMKLDKRVILRRRALMEEEGVVFRTGMNIDSEEKAQELKEQFDAVVLCCGSRQARGLTPRVLDLKGNPLEAADGSGEEIGCTQLKGVYFAVDFLKSTTKQLMKCQGRTVTELEARGGFISAKDKHVVIVGGGDTGNDCIGTVIRHGCKSVTALEMMPAPPWERAASNPWPQWPKIRKIDYGHEEAIRQFGEDPRIYETTVKSVQATKRGAIKKLTTIQLNWEGRSFTEIEGSEKTIPCDLLLIAAGFTGCEAYVAEAFGIERGPRGTILTESGHYATSVPGVFTAGDMHRGASLVVWGITEGRACAREVDQYLLGYTTL